MGWFFVIIATKSDNTVIKQFILTKFIYKCSIKDRIKRINLRVNIRDWKWYYIDN